MKYRYFLTLFTSAVVFFTSAVHAQLVSDNAFLQGQYLEAVIAPNGSWGSTVAVPAAYHKNTGLSEPASSAYLDPVTGTSPSGGLMDFNYDFRHNGWIPGSFSAFYPPWYGPYYMPGTPFDGWAMQVNGVRSDAWYTNYGYWNAAGGTLTGTVNSYQQIPSTCIQTPSMMIGTWNGTAGPANALHISAATRVDTLADWAVVTVKFVNSSADSMKALYYWVSADPDNDETDSLGSFPTNNHVVYQGDALNRHEVSARPPSLHQNAFSGLATKDCRAKAFIYTNWSSHPPEGAGNTLDQIYDETATGWLGTCYYGVGNSTSGEDIAYGLIYKLGDLPPGDSTILSFAWIFSDTAAIDSAFPEPKLSTEGVLHDVYDTVNGCSMTGCGVLSNTKFDADIIGGDSKDWTYSHWTWAPSVGLSTTTGTHVTVTLTALSGVTTFTITGTEDTTHGKCGHTVQLYLTVLPCFSASSNSGGPYPQGICLYDTLKLYAHGDSTDATYIWWGPAGFSAFTQYTERPPMLTGADTGWYYVVRNVGSQSDTTRTYVRFDATPFVTATTNAPICSGNDLDLFATPDSAAETFTWTGPNGFLSGLQNPIITGAPVKDSGTYKVVTNLYGCVDSAYVHVVIDSAPVVPNVWSNSPGTPAICQGDTLKLFSADSTPGVTYAWKGPLSFVSTDQNPMIPNAQPAASGNYTVTVTLNICSDSATTTVSITPTPELIATNNGPICTGTEDTLILQATSVPGATFTWTGPYVFYSLNQNPTRTPVIAEYAGTYSVRAMANGCPSAIVNDTVIVRNTPTPPKVPWLTYCQFGIAPALQAMGDSILWYPTGVPHGVGSLIPPIPATDNVGVTWYYASQTLNSCTSAIDSIRVTVNPKPSVTVTGDVSICPHDTTVLTAVDDDAVAYYHWFPGNYLSDTNKAIVIVRPENDVHYTVVVTNQFGCTDTAKVTVGVYSNALINLGDSVTLYPGESYQIPTQTNCVTFAWYPPAGLDNPGVSSPLASPQISTKYIVHAETSWGCKTTDSISIYIDPEATLAMPNAFTPGNGPNGTFKIIKKGIATLNYFRIWDRWGVKVFETTDIDKGWDGMLNGKPQPFGVFVYEVSAVTATGHDFIKHGNVTLIR